MTPPSRIALAAALALSASAPVMAQPIAKPDGVWRAWLNAGFTRATGNSSASTFTLKTDVVRATDADKWTLYGEALRARSDGVTSGNRARLGGRYDWNLSPRLFSFGSVDLARDTVAELNRRLTLGAGLGYKLVDLDELRFSVFGGLSHTADRYAVPREIGNELRTSLQRPSVLLGEESSHKLTRRPRPTSASSSIPTSTDKARGVLSGTRISRSR